MLPLTGGTGEPAGAIVLAASAGRALDEAYESFLGLVAQQTAALVNGAVAYQAQLRRAEELAELDRAKTTFFSNVSHEFRTPLTLIMGPVDELRPGSTPPIPRMPRGRGTGRGPPQRPAARQAGEHPAGLLPDRGRRTQARFEPVDLGAFTTELASVFQSAFDRAGMRYEVDCPPLNEPVYVDRDMWEKVVFNLLSNALKFTFSGTVSVRLSEEDGHAVLRVADTGVGVAAAEIPRLFDRFHRIENVPSRSNEGSGIGLALVRELVGLHGGSITAESDGRRAPRSRSGSRSAPGTCRRRTWSPGAGRASCRPPPASSCSRRCAGCRAIKPDRRARSARRRAEPRCARPRHPAYCSRTTTPTCASTCRGCCGPATRSPP